MLDAWLNWGSLHEVLGHFADAEACYRKALTLHPNAPRALTRLATLLRGRLPECDKQAMARALDEPEINDNAQISLSFGLAQVADARRDYAGAAIFLEQANRLALEQSRKHHRRYDAVAHGGFVHRLIETFTPELFNRLAGAGNPTRQPVFVFGMPRSGTTLVEQILASHSRVHGAGELRLAAQTFESIQKVVGGDECWPNVLAVLNSAGVSELACRHLRALQAKVDRDRPGFAPERIVDKMPDNYLYAGLLSLMFPRATLIHVRRDPRHRILVLDDTIS